MSDIALKNALTYDLENLVKSGELAIDEFRSWHSSVPRQIRKLFKRLPKKFQL
jgi:hypothetical protein